MRCIQKKLNVIVKIFSFSKKYQENIHTCFNKKKKKENNQNEELQ